jgi:hypothetical protein
MPSSTNAAPSSPQRASDVEAARAELARCLRLLVHLFPDPDFVANPPEIAVLDEYPPLPETPLCVDTSHRLLLYTHGDLNRPLEQVLTTLLHRTVHLANAFQWVQDCTPVSYHTRGFQRLAEAVGFVVARAHRRYGWADTRPGPRLVEIFRDLAVDETVLEPFWDRATSLRKGIRCHCGLPRLPDRHELHEWLREGEDARYRPPSMVRSVKVHRVRQGEGYVPMLRLRGRWLRLFGFNESCPMKIEARPGRLVIEARH